jgi:hypothetical protein
VGAGLPLSLIPATAREVFIPLRDEAELARVPAEYISVYEKPRGELLVTSYRLAFPSALVGSIRLAGEEYPLRIVRVNVGYGMLISASYRVEGRLFMKYEVLEVSYETPEGIARKALFKLKGRGVAAGIVDTISSAAARYREKVRSEDRLAPQAFLKFVEFLSVDKSVRPVYYDTVSRCIAIGSSFFCIKDMEWSVEGSPDIVGKARSWVEEFKNTKLASTG